MHIFDAANFSSLYSLTEPLVVNVGPFSIHRASCNNIRHLLTFVHSFCPILKVEMISPEQKKPSNFFGSSITLKCAVLQVQLREINK